MEVVKFKEVRIGTTTKYSRFGCKDYRFMSEYIYNRCSEIPAKYICWEEGKTSVLIYFLDSKNKSQGVWFLYGSLYPPQTLG